MTDPNRTAAINALEDDAEFLVAHQLDLLMQLEGQLRAVRHTMSFIQELRNPRHRVAGAARATDDDRGNAMAGLASAIDKIDVELVVQHRSCEDMQNCLREMKVRLARLRQAAELLG